MELITQTVSYGDYRVVVRRSKVRDALRRDLLKRALEMKHNEDAEIPYASAFARAISQTVESDGLPFDPLQITPSNIDDAYEKLMDMDEAFLDQWFGAALEVVAALDPVLAPGIDTAKLPKKKQSQD